MVDFISQNWGWLVPVVVLILNGIVKYTPNKKDDFLFDVLVKILFKKIPGLKRIKLETVKPKEPA